MTCRSLSSSPRIGDLLTVSERELVLELVGAAIDETLSAATVFDDRSELRRAYRIRVASLLALLYKIQGAEMATPALEALPSPESLGSDSME
jgi:hypothetical protein